MASMKRPANKWEEPKSKPIGVFDPTIRVAERTVDSTIEERGSSYGDYALMADCIQQLKSVVEEFLNYNSGVIDPPLKESLDMVCTKIGRIVVGDSHHIDSWHDIAGYATLAENYLKPLESK